jgi:hypothetical protein
MQHALLIYDKPGDSPAWHNHPYGLVRRRFTGQQPK